jgi:hypothetical protein
MAHEAAARAAMDDRPMSRAREWWLIAPPALLLFAKAGAAIGRFADPIGSLTRGEAIVELTFAALALVAALGLLARRRVGWLLAMTIVGWDLAISIVLWWRDMPDFLSMALLALTAALITSNDMRRLFASRRDSR